MGNEFVEITNDNEEFFCRVRMLTYPADIEQEPQREPKP